MNPSALLTSFSLLWEKIRAVRQWPIWAACIFLGLALSRILLSAGVYAANNVVPYPDYDAPVTGVSTQNALNQNLDPTSIVGGILFPNASVAAQVAGTPENTGVEDVKFKLLGTLEGDPSFARAVLEVQANPVMTKEYGTGAKIGLTRIAYIGREHIWIKRNGQRLKIKVGESTEEVLQKAAEAPAPTQSDAAAASGETITKVISREEINKTILGNPAEIYKGAAFGPLVENGKITGYKIHKVVDSHVFYKLGARPGDILRKVNGYGLSDTERMFELWKSIKTAPAVQVELERNGKTLKYDFQIRN